MAVEVGQKIPDVEVQVMGDDGMPQTKKASELLGSGKVVLFAVPGAFTPGCSKQHLPGFVQGARQLMDKGVDTIACIAVNDAWVMEAWAKDQGADDILMIGDGNASFAREMGLTMDGAGFGLGTRSQRYAAVIEDGTITRLDVEEGGGVNVSSCENVLSNL